MTKKLQELAAGDTVSVDGSRWRVEDVSVENMGITGVVVAALDDGSALKWGTHSDTLSIDGTEYHLNDVTIT